MSWSNEQISLLIETYEQYPCLYFVKHKDYHNKHLRSLALSKVLKTLKNLRPACTEQEIQKKFLGLRTTYSAERRRVLESLRSGMGEDEVYQPSLWYYTKMAFLNEHLQIRISRSSHIIPEFEESEQHLEGQEEESEASSNPNFDISQNEVDGYFDVTMEGFLSPTSERMLSVESSVQQTTPGYSSPSEVPTSAGSRVKTPSRRLKKPEDSELSTLKNISEGLGKMANTFQLRQRPVTVVKTVEDIMGEFVAAQLKKIKNDDAKEDAQFEIHRILRDALKR